MIEENNRNRIIIIIALILTIVFSIGFNIYQFIEYSNRSVEYNRRVSELTVLSEELGRNYNAVRVRTAELERLIAARAEIDRRAIEEVAGLGRTIASAQSQIGTITERISKLITALREIGNRVTVLQRYYDSLGNLSSSSREYNSDRNGFIAQ